MQVAWTSELLLDSVELEWHVLMADARIFGDSLGMGARRSLWLGGWRGGTLSLRVHLFGQTLGYWGLLPASSLAGLLELAELHAQMFTSGAPPTLRSGVSCIGGAVRLRR